MKDDIISLNLTGYKMEGTAQLTLWGGDRCSIQMRKSIIISPTDENIIKNINDNGFGCESIDRVDAHIYKQYGGSYYKYAGYVTIVNNRIVDKSIKQY